MLDYNSKEYDYICEQIDSEYKSILTYTAIIITFSAAIFAGIARIDPMAADYNRIVEHAMLALANITLMILFLINYKANAYNRLVGYRQILTSEHFHKGVSPEALFSKEYDRRSKQRQPEMIEHAVSYDVCMEHLNRVYDTNEFSFEPVDGLFFDRRGVFKNFDEDEDVDALDRYVSRGFPRSVNFVDRQEYNDRKDLRHDADVTKVPLLSHIMLLFLMFGVFFKYRDGSWRFVSYVNRIVMYLIFIEISVSAYFMIKDGWIWKYFWETAAFNLIEISLVVQLLFSFLMMHIISVYWQDLTFGRRRSSSFFLQFLPFRMIYLMNIFDIVPENGNDKREFEIRPYYIGIPWKKDS